MQFHEVANIFPMMQESELQELAEDIKANGLIDAIWTYRGKIIDGRNRYQACKIAGEEPRYQEWSGGTYAELVAFVVALNVKRRHLTSSQRAAVALDIEERLAEDAKERQGARNDITQRFAESCAGEAREQAAAIVGTNRQYVSDAKKIAQDAPDVLEAVRAGTVNIPQAKQVSKLPEEERAPILELFNSGDEKAGKRAISTARHKQRVSEIIEQSGSAAPALETQEKYHVFYGDPPWVYDFTRDNADAIENHYPTMNIDEICALDIESMSHDDAVLFLWATSPKLKEAMRVIDAWGFEYVTCMVWDKKWIGPGYYARQRHELLLIAKRGALPVPLPENRPPSVVSEKRTDHSKKPDRFYEIIEKMYPEYNKIELFARIRRDGWDAWGNEA